VPIGRPIANTQIYVLDEGLQPVPIGVIGELHIGGVGLARGYFNRPHLTAEKFIPNPFGEAGMRLYRTGDLVRFLPGGEIEFLARVDQQIKLRGYRIELGEIEAALAELVGVREAIVLLRTAGSPAKHLAAFVVLHQGANLSSTQLRSQLADRLPDYMIPSVLMILDEMPLTPNGKTDRAALLAMEVSSPAGANGYIAPRTPVEETLAEIWAEVLGVKRVGVEDNFFELGGHSIMATRIASRVRQKLNTEVSLAMLFDGPPTIAQMAKAIDEYFIEHAEPEKLDEMLQELAELSDEEIRILLASTENANWD
jgi:acyl carrier protein